MGPKQKKRPPKGTETEKPREDPNENNTRTLKCDKDPPKKIESANTSVTYADSLSSDDDDSPRIELFFHSPTQLRQRVQLLQSYGYRKFNLVNKNNDQRDDLLECTQIIREECPTADICVHYSLKYNKDPTVQGRGGAKSDDGSANLVILQEFTERAFGQANEILLVSGGHSPSKPRPRWNTVPALSTLANRVDNASANRPTIAVAYNPYLANNNNIEEETKRLEAKIKTGLVSKIYLQFGTDLHKLRQALELLLQRYHTIQLAGSLFLPTPTLLRQQKARPWNGVFLSEDFLTNPVVAQEIVVQMIAVYQQHNVEILWEAPGIRSEEELQLLSELMVRASMSYSSRNDPVVEEIRELEESEEEEIIIENEAWEIGSDEDAWDAASQYSLDGKEEENNTSERNDNMTHFKTKIVIDERLASAPASNSTCLVLFGAHDLRLYDNLAVDEACKRHARVVPVFLWSPTVIESGGIRAEALEVLIKDAVMNLKKELQEFALDLVLRYAPTDADIREQLADLLDCTGATAIYYNRDFTPHGRHVKEERSKVLKDFPGVEHWGFQSVLLWDVDQVPLTESFPNTYWGTLIPFLKACEYFFGYPRRPIPERETVALLKRARGPSVWPASDSNLPIAVLRPKVRPWHQPIRDCFPDMSHKGAHELMEQFFESKSSGFRRYGYERHRADKEQATSRLSVHLRLGTLSPNELYWRHQDHPMEWEEKKVFCRRLAWRDLAYFHLRCFPNYAYMPVRVHYQNTLWVTGEEAHRRLEAWKWGRTGYPILDAGMRELWTTGYMQQNIRMIAASFLVEHLRVHWVKGCEWFHYTLVDADTAINAMMWQNAGKCGVDQWNFVPSPISASQDPTGRYTKKWVPELRKLPLELLHRPWETPQVILERYGVFLGDNYPHRIVTDLDRERARAVENVVNMRRKAPYFNDEHGCDVIILPNGQSTTVYTTREYRIMKNGLTLPPPTEERKGPSHKERLKARRPKSIGVTSS